MLKYKVGDIVKVVAGKDKGREGKIEKIFPKKNLVLIPEINMYKKHVKGFQGQKGGVYDIPRPISVAKIAIVCPKCKKAARIGFTFAGNEKTRVCKKCKKEISKKAVKKGK